jgi:ankyrin repeat protein
MFPRDLLDKASLAGEPTAWRLDGQSLVSVAEPYMAISHVWADGTGSGAWAEGEVNECLYRFFERIARRWQCKGIWWDTICIPRDKAARARAINTMERNYESARITLVHDCYIRNWEWVDGETACLAIIMSPWFSRGWTALELARSRKVKVMFKGSVIKDLDEDILSKSEDDSACHRYATEAIKGLRKQRVESLNDLLTVLGPRSTSWPRDMAIISSLLVGIKEAVGEKQQEIYRAILGKIGWVAHGHLFHRSATMTGGFSWCPTNLLALPMADTSSERELEILDDGTLRGEWSVIQPKSVPAARYVLHTGFPLVDMKVSMTLESGSQCVLLGEPDVTLFRRAIAVRMLGSQRGRYEFKGPVYFNPPLAQRGLCEFMGPVYFSPPLARDEVEWEDKDIIIGATKKKKKEEEETRSYEEPVRFAPRPLEQERPSFLNIQWGKFSGDGNEKENSKPTDTRLLEAVMDGDEAKVRDLFYRDRPPINLQGSGGYTAMHHAVRRGHHDIIRVLFQEDAKSDIRDELGQQSIHLAAERGDEELLMDYPEFMEGHQPCKDGQTALHRAVLGECLTVVKLLLNKFGAEMMDAQDSLGRTALHLSAELGQRKIIAELICRNANMELKDSSGRTILHYAAMNSNNDPVILDTLLGYEILETLQEYDILNLPDNDGRMPLHYAASIGYVDYLNVLVNKTHLGVKDSLGQTALEVAADAGHLPVIQFLLDKDIERKELPQASINTALHIAASAGDLEMAQALVKHGASICSRDSGDKTALETALEQEHPTVILYLTECVLSSDPPGEVPAGWVGVVRKRPQFTEPSALHYAMSRGYAQVANVLIKEGEDIYKTAEDGTTVLSLAVTKGAETVIESLVAVYGKAISAGVQIDHMARIGAVTKQQRPLDYWNYELSRLGTLADSLSLSWAAVQHLEQAFRLTNDPRVKGLLAPKLETIYAIAGQPMALGESIAPSTLYGRQINTEQPWDDGPFIKYAPLLKGGHSNASESIGEDDGDESDERESDERESDERESDERESDERKSDERESDERESDERESDERESDERESDESDDSRRRRRGGRERRGNRGRGTVSFSDSDNEDED